MGPKHKQNPDRTAKRHGHERRLDDIGWSSRARSSGRGCGRSMMSMSCRLRSYEYFADRDPLTRAVMDRMLAGVSTRKYAEVGEPVGEDVEASSTLDVEEHGVRDVHRADRHRAGRADEPPSRRRALGSDDARRAGDRRSHACRRARDLDRGRQDPARAVGRLDRERDAGPHAAGRSGRPRPGPVAGDPLRHRRREGHPPGDQGRVRRARARTSVPSAQGEECL